MICLFLLTKKGFFLLKTHNQNMALPQSFPSDVHALYIHWPFCLSKCPYCDFNSHVQNHLGTQEMVDALCTELETLAMRVSVKNGLRSIFFGGGTPSLMPPKSVERLIQKAQEHLGLAESCEITLEANPTTFEKERFSDFLSAGVNRLSIGIQSFDDEKLKILGRTHSALEARRALEHSRAVFPAVSFDLMYGLPNQTLNHWQDELETAASFEPTHISCYQLTFEPGTAFYTRYDRGELTYPEEDLALSFDGMTEDFWSTRGLTRYEVSNYAKTGFQSRHNLAYWQYEPTLGIGPGSHGRPFLGGIRHREVTFRNPQTWLKAVQQKGHGLQNSVPLSTHDLFEERLMMGLRLTRGVQMEHFDRCAIQKLKKRVSVLKKEGLVEIDHKNTLKTTSSGRMRLNSVVRFLCESD